MPIAPPQRKDHRGGTTMHGLSKEHLLGLLSFLPRAPYHAGPQKRRDAGNKGSAGPLLRRCLPLEW